MHAEVLQSVGGILLEAGAAALLVERILPVLVGTLTAVVTLFTFLFGHGVMRTFLRRRSDQQKLADLETDRANLMRQLKLVDEEIERVRRRLHDD